MATEHPLDSEEIDENTISELLAKNPLELEDNEIERIVHMLRAARSRWESTQRRQKKDSPGKKTSRQAGGITSKAKKKLDTAEKSSLLDDLF